MLKDPYNFDFLTLSEDARERELEMGLLVEFEILSANFERVLTAHECEALR